MSAARSVGLFAVVVVLIVGGAAVAPFAVGTGDAGYAPVENENFRPDEIVAAESPEEGEIAMDSDTTGRTVLIDAGHGNDYSESALRPLVSTLTRNGHTVEF